MKVAEQNGTLVQGSGQSSTGKVKQKKKKKNRKMKQVSKRPWVPVVSYIMFEWMK